MVTLKQIDPANFHITNPDSDGTDFTYYTVVRGPGGINMSFWDIVGVSQKSPSPFILLRLLHIEEDELEAADFDALKHASGHLSLDPDGLLALITFLEGMIVETSGISVDVSERLFRPVSAEDLQRFHFKPYWQKRYTRYCYRYLPTQEIFQQTVITLLILPLWSPEHGRNQRTALIHVSFHEEQLADPTFDPLRQDGAESITLDQPALKALVDLLKQHTYEHFVGMTHHQ